MAAQQVGHRLLFLKSMRSWNNRPDEPRFRRTERYTMPSSSFSSNLHREATEDEGQQDLGVPTLEIPMYASDGHTLTYTYTVLALLLRQDNKTKGTWATRKDRTRNTRVSSSISVYAYVPRNQPSGSSKTSDSR